MQPCTTTPDLPIHPTTGLQALGFTSRGPIWPVRGGAPTPEEEAAAAAAATGAAATTDDDAAAAAAAAGDDGDGDGDGGDDEPLGPKGQKALDAEKQKRRTANAARRTAEQALAEAQTEIARMKAGGAGDDAEQARQQVITEAQKTANAKANARILKSEVKRLATGKLANPAIALQLLDVSGFEVSDDGDVDEDEINDAIAALITKEPYLAAQGRRFGDADAGPRNGGDGKGKKPPQVTEAQLATMSHEEIVKAQNEGRLADLLGQR